MNKDKTIIMFTGYKRSGKDTAAKIVLEKVGGEIFKFADPLRRFVKDLLVIDDKELEEKKDEKPYRFSLESESLDSIFCGYPGESGEFLSYAGKKMSIRDLMIVFSEGLKKYYGNEIFCEAAEKKIRNSKASLCIISDLRYPFEAEYFKKRFEKVFIVKIKRPGIGLSSNHSSETSINDITPDFEINNDGGIRELEQKILEIVKNLNF